MKIKGSIESKEWVMNAPQTYLQLESISNEELFYILSEIIIDIFIFERRDKLDSRSFNSREHQYADKNKTRTSLDDRDTFYEYISNLQKKTIEITELRQHFFNITEDKMAFDQLFKSTILIHHGENGKRHIEYRIAKAFKQIQNLFSIYYILKKTKLHFEDDSLLCIFIYRAMKKNNELFDLLNIQMHKNLLKTEENNFNSESFFKRIDNKIKAFKNSEKNTMSKKKNQPILRKSIEKMITSDSNLRKLMRSYRKFLKKSKKI